MPPASRSVLRNRNFRIYLTGSVFSTNGIWIQRLTLGWMAWDSTHSEFWVGAVAFLLFVPIILLGPMFGVLADRTDRRRAAVITMSSVLGVTLAFATITVLFDVDIVAVCVVATLFGIANSAYHPIRLTLVPMLVERTHLPSAVALNVTVFNISRLLGPALAGVLISLGGVTWAFAVNALLYVPMLLALGAVTVVWQPAESARRAVFSELASGIKYALSSVEISRFLVLVAINSVFGRGLLELLPVFADGVYARGSAGLAMLTSSAGAGAIVAGVVMSRVAVSRHRTSRIGVFAVGVACLLLAFSEAFATGVILVAALGLAITAVGIASQSAIQMHVDDDYRGRVMSLWGTIGFGGTALGGLAIGALSELLGLSNATSIWGVVCVAAVAVTIPAARRQPA
ncbi:MAG: MFS transporter [Gammaproteobacteria bacterium]|nr:MFS transporter [Gammaproteobacteria bacterium]